MKNIVKQLFKRLPSGWSEMAQGFIWSGRSAAFVATVPFIRFLSNTLGGRFPLAAIPRGVESVRKIGARLIAIPGTEVTPPIHARTLGQLKLEEFADVPLLPESIVLAELNRAYVDGATGAVLDSKRRLVTELSPYAKRSPVKRPWDHPAFYRIKRVRTSNIPGTAVLLSSPNGGVYFHWLLELLPRLGLLQAEGLLPENFRCLVSQSGGFVADCLHAAGIPPDRVEVLDPGTRYQIERLLTTSDLFPQGMAKTLAPWLREIFLKPEATPSGETSLIYITRRDSGLRTVENEEKLIAIVEEQGGRVAVLEGMDVRQQAALFNTSSCIVTPHGSALSNIVFCRPGTRILELYSPAYVRVLYPRIGTALNLDYWYLIGQGKREREGRPSLYASIKIDEEDFRKTLLTLMDPSTGKCA